MVSKLKSFLAKNGLEGPVEKLTNAVQASAKECPGLLKKAAQKLTEAADSLDKKVNAEKEKPAPKPSKT